MCCQWEEHWLSKWEGGCSSIGKWCKESSSADQDFSWGCESLRLNYDLTLYIILDKNRTGFM